MAFYISIQLEMTPWDSCQGCCRPDCRFTCIQHIAGRTKMPNVLLDGDAP